MITNTTAKSTYIVASGVTEYAIGFTYKTNPDGTPQIKVYKNKLSNTPLVYSVDYTISENGLNIVVDTAVEPGDRLDIIRNIPLVQLSDYVIGRIDPEQIEGDFDASVMRDQQIESDIQFVGEVPQDHENRIQECESDIDDLESLVPAQATDENQLADKNFVNSSIATSTATFKGTYSSLVDLQAVTADANDYGFVVSTDAAGNTVYSRYKYDGTSWAFEYNLNNSSFTAEQWAAINSGITADIVESLGATTGKNVGEVFFTMRNDNGLRGAVECNGASYYTTDFVGAQSIGTLLESGKLPYVSLSQYATLLVTNGSVGVFGWDGQGTTEFRVPSLNDIFVETGTAAQVGDYIAPGLPNITGNFANWGKNPSASGAFSYTAVDTANRDAYSGQGSGSFSFNASRSSNIYGASSTVQPKAVRYRAMVQLAVAATDEALETCTSVLADVAGMKSHEVIAFQAPTSENNYTWYRKYADGWVEQGGITTSGSIVQSVALPVTMADTNYTISLVATSNNASGKNNVGIVGYENVSTTGFDTRGNTVNGQNESSTATGTRRWYVAGMYAQS